MDARNVLTDLAQRPIEAAKRLPKLSEEQLNAHPGGHPNSIAWLLWHSGREVDVQLAALNGKEELWSDYRERFGLGEIGDSIGYGHSADEAASITATDQQLLVEYLEATLTALSDYVTELNHSQLDDIVDERWDPPVTRGVRLISIINDAAQHIGQAAYAAGMLTD